MSPLCNSPMSMKSFWWLKWWVYRFKDRTELQHLLNFSLSLKYSLGWGFSLLKLEVYFLTSDLPAFLSHFWVTFAAGKLSNWSLSWCCRAICGVFAMRIFVLVSALKKMRQGGANKNKMQIRWCKSITWPGMSLRRLFTSKIHPLPWQLRAEGTCCTKESALLKPFT